MAINFIEPNKDGSALRVGIVVARFNEWACNAMLEACLAQLKNLGVKDIGTIRLFYPAETTEYWHDFYNFMLVTVNGGKYPTTSAEMDKAVEYVERFINSEYTEAVVDFNERLNRTDGFSENCLYVMPEAIAKKLSNGKSEYVRLIFPLQTTYMYYYVIGNTDNGKAVVKAINESDFFSKLRSNNYRSTKYYEWIILNYPSF